MCVAASARELVHPRHNEPRIGQGKFQLPKLGQGDVIAFVGVGPELVEGRVEFTERRRAEIDLRHGANLKKRI